MRRADDLADSAQRGLATEDSLPDQRVLVNELPLVIRQGPRFPQNGVGDRELADIVQFGRKPELRQLVAAQAQLAADGDGQPGHTLDVGAQARFTLGQRPQQQLVRARARGRQPVL